MAQVIKASAPMDLFMRASKESDKNRFRSAFRYLLAAARAGEKEAFVNLGYCYDTGEGTAPDRVQALYWYKRAYRRGDDMAATNIGTIWRDEGQPKRALYWFKRGAELGDGDAYLEIAKIYISFHGDHDKATEYLNKVLKSAQVTEDSREQARALLSKL